MARNWHVDKARKMLEETLKWRSAYKPEEIRWVGKIIFRYPFYLLDFVNKDNMHKINIFFPLT